MEIVLDSVSLNHLLRAPKKVRERFNECVGTVLDAFIEKGQLKLALDSSKGLLGEWCTTCDRDVVQVLITKWESNDGIVIVEKIGALSRAQNNKLRQYGFIDGGDKLIVKIAISTRDHLIVSDDSDFWDPLQKKNHGNKKAPVALLLREELNILVLLLGHLMSIYLKPAKATSKQLGFS